MILMIVLVAAGFILLCFLLVLSFSLKITLQGTPFLCKIRLLFCQIQFNSTLVQVTFLKFKKKIYFEQIFTKITQKIYARFFLKKTKQQASNTKKPTKKKIHTTSIIGKKELLQLTKKLYFCVRVKKIDFLLYWDDFYHVGYLYAIRQLLPLNYQKNIKISFYQETRYYCILHISLGQILYQCFFWYLKIFLKKKFLTKNYAAKNN